MLGTAFLGAGCGASASDADTRLDADGSATAKARPAAAKSAAVVRELTVPQGTLLHLKLTTAVASDTTRVEDADRRRAHRADHDRWAHCDTGGLEGLRRRHGSRRRRPRERARATRARIHLGEHRRHALRHEGRTGLAAGRCHER